jgi:hypothetical protein
MRLTYIDKGGDRLTWQEGESFFLTAGGVLFLGDTQRSWEIARVELGGDRLLGTAQINDEGQQLWMYNANGDPISLRFPQFEIEIGEPLIASSLGVGVGFIESSRILIIVDDDGRHRIDHENGSATGVRTLAHLSLQDDEFLWTPTQTPGGIVAKSIFFTAAPNPWTVTIEPGRRERLSALSEGGRPCRP